LNYVKTNNNKPFGADQFIRRFLPLGLLEVPPGATVHLWFLDLKALASPLGLAEDKEDFSSLKPRHERTIRRFYLRLLLGAYLGLPGKDVVISRLVKGKPVLDVDVHHRQIDFSSASSDGCCLIGISAAGLIGVDLELADRKTGKPLSLARRYFSATEQQRFDALKSSEIDRAFMHTWACKEAVVKAAGHGIANQLCRFSVSVDPEIPPAMLEFEGDDVSGWQLAIVRPAARFLAAVALKHHHLRLEGFSLRSRKTQDS